MQEWHADEMDWWSMGRHLLHRKQRIFCVQKVGKSYFKKFQKIMKSVQVIYDMYLLPYFIEICLTSCINPQMLPEPRPMTAPVLQTGPMSGVLALSADWSLRSRGLWLWRISNQISIPRLLVKWSPHGIDPISTTINRYQQLCLWFVADSHTHKVFLIVEHVFL